MRTYSHVLLALAASEAIRLPAKRKAALAVGSALPDVPLGLLTIGYTAYHRWITKRNLKRCSDDYNQLYFTNKGWIGLHHLFHAPLLLGGWWIFGRNHTHTRDLLIGCAAHTLVDIPTHHNDGPLLLYPLNSTTRFRSPISYWDEARHGKLATTLEYIIDAGVIVWLLIRFLRDE